MNINGLTVFLLIVISGPLVITVLFYGGKWALHFLETPDSPKAMATFKVEADSVIDVPKKSLTDTPPVAIPTV